MSSYNRRGCFRCGDPLDDLFCQRRTCELCGNDAHYGYNEAILLQEQAVEEKQELLAEEQAANPSEPLPVSYFDNADYDNISTPSTTYTIHLTKSATIITNPSEPTRRIFHNHDIFYDGDDDEELFPDEFKRVQQILERTLFNVITPDNSLSIGDEHLSTIPETESDELIKSSVENLVPIPSESEDFSDIEMTTSHFSDEDVPKEIYSNPLFDEEIISTKIDPHHFNAESDLIESLLNQDTLIISSPKIDYLLEEFSGELTYIDLIPPGINEADFNPEEEIRLVEKLLYDNSSPRPLEEFNSNAVIQSFSPSPIHVEGSDSLMEEINIFLSPDDSIPSGIENDDHNSEGDILFLGELLTHDPL
ncbi:hypothetical protein Tco_1521714, partial [Tanacetum coccineum]